MKVDKHGVLKFLPHREPFLFIDGITSLVLSDENAEKEGIARYVKGELKAVFKVDSSLDILRGHFPGNPILPGVVQVEVMAQASCFFMHDFLQGKKYGSLEVALLSVSHAKFRQPVKPGMELTITSILTKARGEMMGFDCKIEAADQVISEASILASCRVLS